MKAFNEFVGLFRWGHGSYTFRSLDYYKFVISIIFHNYEYHIPSNFVNDLFKTVDDFAYCGRYGSTYLFAIIINHKVGVMDQYFNLLIAPKYKELIPPVQSAPIFVIKDEDGNYGAIDALTQKIVVDFGEYLKLWGFDHNICLSCTEYEDNYNDKTNRCIIDNRGRIVISSNQYYTIYPFYNTGVKYIIVRTSKVDTLGCLIINKKLDLLCKDNPRQKFVPYKDSVEAPSNNIYFDDINISDQMDAYEGDYDALWNTD